MHVSAFIEHTMLYLKTHVRKGERIVRFVGGIAGALAAATLVAPGPLRWLALASALAVAGTGVVGFCPACWLFGRRGS